MWAKISGAFLGLSMPWRIGVIGAVVGVLAIGWLTIRQSYINHGRQLERQDIAKKLNLESAERLDEELNRILGDEEVRLMELEGTAAALEDQKADLQAKAEELTQREQEWVKLVANSQRDLTRYAARATQRQKEVAGIADVDLNREWLAELCRGNPGYQECRQ